MSPAASASRTALPVPVIRDTLSRMPAKDVLRWKIIAAYGAVYLAWGSTYFAIKIGVSHFSAAGMAGIRFLLAGVMMIGLGRLMRGGAAEPATRRQLVHAALIGCVLLGGGTGFLGYAERTVPSGICALVIGCSPILFAVFNRIAGGPRLTPNQIAGGVLGTVGVAVLSLQKSAWTGGQVPYVGLGLLIFGMFCWVSASVVSKHVALPKDTALTAAVQMLTAGTLLLTAGRLRGEFLFSNLPHLPQDTALAILYLATFGSCVGFTAYSWLLRHEPSNRVSSYAFVNPVVAVFLGVVFGGERFTAPIAVACVAVLAGVSLSLFGARWTKALLPATEPEA
ncbi:MAG: EamA family transporter [Elusimicrobia bacterium]|nr:EamA family transporter [Elusimicrobiota bacterium]